VFADPWRGSGLWQRNESGITERRNKGSQVGNSAPWDVGRLNRLAEEDFHHLDEIAIQWGSVIRPAQDRTKFRPDDLAVTNSQRPPDIRLTDRVARQGLYF